MLRSAKFRLYPTAPQALLMDKQFGCARYVWNWALDYSSWQYRHNNTATFRQDWCRLLPKLKAWFPWLMADANAQSLQSEMIHLQDAFTRFFRNKAGRPKFKSKNDKQSLSLPQQFRLVDGHLSITKIKNIKCIVTRDLSDYKLRSVTITKTTTGKYYASVLYETGCLMPEPVVLDKARALGVDLGVKTFAVLSTGEFIANPRFLEKGSKRLRLLSKSLSRKKKGSFNRAKARLKVALHHEKISFRRNDFLHKLTHKLVVENQATSLCIEDLNVKGMMKNRKLSKAIGSCNWSEFIRQLKYKCSWYGKNLLQCSRWAPTSKTCSQCGIVKSDLTLSERTFVCTCGARLDRDLNASLNIVDYAFRDLYPEDTGDFKPVEMKALALAGAA